MGPDSVIMYDMSTKSYMVYKFSVKLLYRLLSLFSLWVCLSILPRSLINPKLLLTSLKSYIYCHYRVSGNNPLTFIKEPSKTLSRHLSFVCVCLIKYVTLDHKTSHKGPFFKIEVYITSSWINKLSIDVWFVMIGQYLAEIQLFEHMESEGAKIWKYWENHL